MNDMNMNMGEQMPNPVDAMPRDMQIDERAIKRMAGEAISKVDGVLGVDGSLADILKAGDDMTKGVSVTLSDDRKAAQVSTKIITEYGKNIPTIVGSAQNAVRDALRDMAGLAADKVEVEVTDIMTREEYRAKTSKNRGLA